MVYVMRKFHDELNESTITGGYPDDGSTGPASDDDGAPGTTVFGDKMVPVEVENRLTGKTIKYVPAADLEHEWNYDEFENSKSMGSIKAYSKTLDDLDGLLGGRLFKHTDRRKFRMQQDKWVSRSGEQDGSGTNQTSKLGDDEEESMDITEKINQYMGDNVEQIEEAIIDKDDRKGLVNAIVKGKPIKLKLDSLGGVEVQIAGKGDNIKVWYKKNEDLTLALVDLCDTLGYEFKLSKSGEKQEFLIMK